MRRLINSGSKVDGWIDSKKGVIELYSYVKGYIGKVVNGTIYDESNKVVAPGTNENIENYIIRKNSSLAVNRIREY